MDEPQSAASSTPVYTKPPGVFGTKIPSSLAFAVGILLFFMPFVDITCNSMPFQTFTGVQLAIGPKITMGGSNNTFLGNMNDSNNSLSKTEREKPNSYALVALGLGVLGFILSLQGLKMGGASGMIIGILSAVALVGLMVDIRSKIKTKMPEPDQSLQINVDITPWFYVTVIVFLAASFLSYKRLQAKEK